MQWQCDCHKTCLSRDPLQGRARPTGFIRSRTKARSRLPALCSIARPTAPSRLSDSTSQQALRCQAQCRFLPAANTTRTSPTAPSARCQQESVTGPNIISNDLITKAADGALHTPDGPGPGCATVAVKGSVIVRRHPDPEPAKDRGVSRFEHAPDRHTTSAPRQR